MLAVTAGVIAEDALFIAAVIVATLLVGRVVRVVVAALLRRVASRSLLGAYSTWRVRMPRLVAESVPIAELRRQHRVNATAAMITRLVKVGLWLIAVIVVMQRLEVDVIIAVSGAGFLGAAVAIGAQNSVHDYMNGLHILLEDRFGEGDVVQITTDMGETIEGTVSRLGAFAARIETEEGSFHIANRRAFQVRNLSQRGYRHMFDVQVERLFDDDSAAAVAVRSAISKSVSTALGIEEIGVVIDSVAVESVRRGRSTLRVVCRFGSAVTDEQISRVAEQLGSTLER